MKAQLTNSIACPLCGKDNYKEVYPSTLTKKDFDSQNIKKNLKNTLDNYKKHSRIVRCNECYMVYTNPLENFAQLLKGYEDVVDEEYVKTESFRKILLKEHLERIEKFTTPGRVLDIGCFAGFFLEIAKKRSWKVHGIEPSTWATEIAKRKKITIIADDIENVSLKPNTYDLITMWDVIEHLPNPRKVLQTCHKAMKKNGIIALGTPNIESLVATLLKKNNPYLIRMHIMFFSPKTLRRLLEEEGFTILKVYSYGRTFPLSYVLDRIAINSTLYKKVKKFVNSSKFLSQKVIHVNIGDSFGIIAQKK
jgi:2-polyprenyl-3-methyl-5-hydroxy-6-metoxy-1,4-benzoquinol methylase